MGANVEGLVREGMNAIKAGRKDEGKALLLKAVELDQYNAEAWLWLSGTMDSLDDQRTCLENVLAVDPNNQRAKQGLEYLAKLPPGISLPGSPSSPPPLTNRAAATSTSVEWSAPATPPAPSWSNAPAPKEPTEADLDAWVSNLNLPGAVSVKPGSGAQSSPFTDLNLGTDDFADGPFGTQQPPAETKTPPAAPQSRAPQTPAAPASPASTAPRSPVPDKMPSFGFDDDDEAAADAFVRREAAKAAGGSLLFDADSDQDGTLLEEGEGALFAQIPGEIKVTRIPGTRERAPFPLILVAVLLVIINVGAAALLAISLLAA